MVLVKSPMLRHCQYVEGKVVGLRHCPLKVVGLCHCPLKVVALCHCPLKVVGLCHCPLRAGEGRFGVCCEVEEDKIVETGEESQKGWWC